MTAASRAGTLRLGGSLVVNRLGLGAMRVTGDGIWGDPPDPAAARRLLQRAVELGVNLIDTADSYGPGTSERLIAEALHPYPAGLVIATKAGIVRPVRERWDRDGRPEHIREACEASLRRLRLECIDLYQFHAVDPQVPLEDSIGEFARLQAAGKVRHVGVSNFDVDQIERARRLVEVVSVQNRCNVADRSSDAVIEYCEREGIAFLPWSPLTQSPNDSGSPRRRALERVAAARGISFAQASLAWLLTRSAAMLPIPGTSSTDHLERNVAAAGLRLSENEMQEIG